MPGSMRRYRNRTRGEASARPFDRSPRPAFRDGIPSLMELP
ncbi:hypothetical protein DESPIG_02456 [Desulfovibrio piger ATCC 29098]|uniref:Uncharacterized protein n=1 Tax=Desulfovibrio piger ATCC 29098 TaxID=411464 RepID=B6WWI8_9BACT|nr:hypothetical protein DESPIG_02456 [Desulfovibrio piger ATCC 29098]